MTDENKDGAPTDRSEAAIDTDRKLIDDKDGEETKQGDGMNP